MPTSNEPPRDPPAPTERWVSFAEAQRILGLSETTLRRMIRQGRVTAEAQPRAEGDTRIIYRVLVTDPPSDPPAATVSESAQPPVIHRDPSDTLQEIASGLLERLAAADEHLAMKDAEIARINAENADLRERAAAAEATAKADARRMAERLADERERRLAAEQERDRLRAWRWYDPRTW